VKRHFSILSDDVQSIMDLVISLIFSAEAAAKIVVYGLAFGKSAYIKSPWNVLDFVTVTVCNFALLLRQISPAAGDFSYLKALRTLRALRPIRMASAWPGMKVGWISSTQQLHHFAPLYEHGMDSKAKHWITCRTRRATSVQLPSFICIPSQH
jgi:hypothetical protein